MTSRTIAEQRRFVANSAPGPRPRRCRRPTGPSRTSSAKTSLAIELLMVPLVDQRDQARRAPPASAARRRRPCPARSSCAAARPSPSCWPPWRCRRRPRPPRSSRPAPGLREHAGVVVRHAVARDEAAAPRLRQLRHRARARARCARRRRPAAAGRAPGSSGSRAPLPCCASSACGRCAESQSRVSWTTRPPFATTSICRSISYSIAFCR